MMYDKTIKQHRIEFHLRMAWMEQAGVARITLHSPANPKAGGMTVGFIRPFPRSKMIFVAVSYCSKGDKFDVDAGKFHLAGKLQNAEAIQLPLGHLSDAEIVRKLADMFKAGVGL